MAKIVSFYSYKGGVGRSLCLANVAVLLAQRGRRVVCVDCDLEAGGLHTIFGINPEQIRFTILDVLLGTVTPERSLVKLSAMLSNVLPGGDLWLLPAISEVGKIGRVMADRRDLPTALNHVIEQIEDRLLPHYILVDSRSGFAELADMAIRTAERLVCILRPNRQNADGLRMLLDILNVRRSSPNAFLVLSQVPEPDAVGLTRTLIDNRLQELAKIIGPGRSFGATIPYSAALALEESVVAITQPSGFLVGCYQPIVEWIEEES